MHRCAKRPQPGAVALRDWLGAHVKRGRSPGIFSCRNIRGATSLSLLHAAGRAVDWKLGEAADGWRAYRPGPNGSLHTDHVHLGMNVPGSRMKTSFWR